MWEVEIKIIKKITNSDCRSRNWHSLLLWLLVCLMTNVFAVEIRPITLQCEHSFIHRYIETTNFDHTVSGCRFNCRWCHQYYLQYIFLLCESVKVFARSKQNLHLIFFSVHENEEFYYFSSLKYRFQKTRFCVPRRTRSFYFRSSVVRLFGR